MVEQRAARTKEAIPLICRAVLLVATPANAPGQDGIHDQGRPFLGDGVADGTLRADPPPAPAHNVDAGPPTLIFVTWWAGKPAVIQRL